MLVGLQSLIDLASIVDLLVHWANQLEKAIISSPIYVVNGFDYEA